MGAETPWQITESDGAVGGQAGQRQHHANDRDRPQRTDHDEQGVVLRPKKCQVAFRGVRRPAIGPGRMADLYRRRRMFQIGLALLSAMLTEPAAYRRAFAVWSAVGGVRTDWFGWPAIFLINVPVGLIVLMASARPLPDDVAGSLGAENPYPTGAFSATAAG
ncbi:hypothetical protein [Nocardia tengchongensis]|uniref:hypothetical protein n=1 Tax=Nocardia tengchongensis TaxID=2055889 RepID=UPI0036653B47